MGISNVACPRKKAEGKPQPELLNNATNAIPHVCIVTILPIPST
jgi:hypothetical protein